MSDPTPAEMEIAEDFHSMLDAGGHGDDCRLCLDVAKTIHSHAEEAVKARDATWAESLGYAHASEKTPVWVAALVEVRKEDAIRQAVKVRDQWWEERCLDDRRSCRSDRAANLITDACDRAVKAATEEKIEQRRRFAAALMEMEIKLDEERKASEQVEEQLSRQEKELFETRQAREKAEALLAQAGSDLRQATAIAEKQMEAREKAEKEVERLKADNGRLADLWFQAGKRVEELDRLEAWGQKYLDELIAITNFCVERGATGSPTMEAVKALAAQVEQARREGAEEQFRRFEVAAVVNDETLYRLRALPIDPPKAQSKYLGETITATHSNPVAGMAPLPSKAQETGAMNVVSISTLPLHIQVAFALGHQTRHRKVACNGPCAYHLIDSGGFPKPTDHHSHDLWEMYDPYANAGLVDEEDSEGAWVEVPDYTADWSVTGPLLHRFRIAVIPAYRNPHQPTPSCWTAVASMQSVREGTYHTEADTPLEAVCLLIVHLHSIKKLEPNA